ncbi:EAL domain-containing protein, partial [Azospirillum sp. TSO22-1]|uniref:EAL domain-containing protein n=1 Tax=Azospirillum sp. TSO22-1 TaxID=716789 RepID=UPI000D613E58
VLPAAARAAPATPTVEALSAAIETGRLFLLYQPKVDIATKRLVGVEALVRWRDEAGRVIPPDSFIPLAEASGLIDRLTAWVVDCAIGQVGEWRRKNLDLRVAVNLSAGNLHNRRLPDLLAARCDAAGVAADHVILELTETASMQDFVTMLEVLGRFRLKGFHLSVDDFGTGYSSVARLLRLPFSELKVDRSFVSGMADMHESAVVTKALIDLAHNLGLSAVAEGVETRAAFEMLEKWGCDVAQGYFFSRPTEAAAIEAMVLTPTWGE